MNPPAVAVSVWRLMTSAQHAPGGGAAAGDSTVNVGGLDGNDASRRHRAHARRASRQRRATELARRRPWSGSVVPPGPRHDRKARAEPGGRVDADDVVEHRSVATLHRRSADQLHRRVGARRRVGRLDPVDAGKAVGRRRGGGHGGARGGRRARRRCRRAGTSWSMSSAPGSTSVWMSSSMTSTRPPPRQGSTRGRRDSQGDGDERPRSHEPARLATPTVVSPASPGSGSGTPSLMRR